jgi:Tol biopolymer transport system component
MKRLLLLMICAVPVLSLNYSEASGSAESASASAALQRSSVADGSKIAFSRLKDTPASNEFLETEIWVMNGDGSEPRRLTHNTTWDLSPVWSPNGKTVAFYALQFDALGQTPISAPHIYLINADGSDEHLLTEMWARFPSWSSNGRIAFDNGGPNSGDIFVINPDGSGLEQLTHDPSARNIRPDWSPNGQKIAFSRRHDGNEDVYVMNADGSDTTRLTSNPASDIAPAWSPDGKKILFQSSRDGNTEIYVMDADGTNQTRLTEYLGRDQDADWSPNGKQIAFEREIEPIGQQILQVYVMNADGTDQQALTALPSENAHPGWGRGAVGADGQQAQQ